MLILSKPQKNGNREPYFRFCCLNQKTRNRESGTFADALAASECPQWGFLTCQPTPGDSESQGEFWNAGYGLSQSRTEEEAAALRATNEISWGAWWRHNHLILVKENLLPGSLHIHAVYTEAGHSTTTSSKTPTGLTDWLNGLNLLTDWTGLNWPNLLTEWTNYFFKVCSECVYCHMYIIRQGHCEQWNSCDVAGNSMHKSRQKR